MMKQKTKQTQNGEIPEGWKIKKIADVAEVVGGGTPSTKIPKYWEGEIAWITPRDLSNYLSVHISRGERNITQEGLENSSAKLLPKGAVLLTSRAPIGYVVIADNEMTTNQGFRSLIPKEKESCSEFLYYLLKWKCSFLKSMAFGSTFGELSGTTLKNLEFLFPNLAEQKSIAKILSDLDAKIELNNKMSQTFESLGKALFGKWFMDLEDIPKDWKTKPLDKIADFLNGLALQKYPAKEGEEYLPAIKIRELRSGITDQTDKISLTLPKEYLIEDGDILFSWSGSLEVVIWTNGKGALNQHLFKVSSKEYPKWFCYYWVKHHLPNFKHIAEGKATTMGHIQKHNLSESEVLVPDKFALDKMNAVMNPLLNKIISLKLEARNLEKIRDALLPKLMSGEIRVK